MLLGTIFGEGNGIVLLLMVHSYDLVRNEMKKNTEYVKELEILGTSINGRIDQSNGIVQ